MQRPTGRMVMVGYMLFTDLIAFVIYLISRFVKKESKQTLLKVVGVSYLISMHAILRYLEVLDIHVIGYTAFANLSIKVFAICYLTCAILALLLFRK